jgi:hypothetical protein
MQINTKNINLEKYSEIVSSIFDEIFRGEVHFIRYRPVDFLRLNEFQVEVFIDMYIIERTLPDPKYCFFAYPDKDNPRKFYGCTHGVRHLIEGTILIFKTRNGADNAIEDDLETYETGSTRIDEDIGWENTILSDSEIEEALTYFGLMDGNCWEDPKFKIYLDKFLNDKSDIPLNKSKKRLKQFFANN